MRPKTITLSPTALDRNGFCQAQTTAAAADLLLNGALSSGYDRNGLCAASTPTAAGTMSMDGALAESTTRTVFTSERYLIIYSDGDDSGVNFHITGTNKEGHVIYEITAGPDSVSKASTNKYLTVTNVYISGAGTGSIEIGSAGIGTMTTDGAVGIYSGGDESDITFTVYGIDRYGNDNSETITGPDTTTVTGAVDWSIIHRIATSAAVGNNVEVGSVGTVFSQWIPVDRYGGDISLAVTLSSGASMTYAIQHTFENVQANGFQEDDANVFVHATMTGETTSQDGSYSTPIYALRLAITSFVSGTATLEVVQSGS